MLDVSRSVQQRGNTIMGFFSKVLRRAPRTDLERFLSTLGPEKAMATYDSVTNPDLRLASALSILVLLTTGKFCKSANELISKLERATTSQGHHPPYDVMAFEVAAYCHYWLMRKEL